MERYLKDLKKKWKISLDLLAEEVEAPIGFIVRFLPDAWEIFVTNSAGESPFPCGVRQAGSLSDLSLDSLAGEGIFSHPIDHDHLSRELGTYICENDLSHYCGLTVTHREELFGILFLGGSSPFSWDDRRENFFRRFKTMMEEDLEVLADKARFGEELREAREEYLLTSMENSDFLKTVTREISHPINAIAGYSRIIAKSAGSELQDYARVINENRTLLQEILLSLREFSRSEGGEGEIHPEEIPILPLMDDLHRSHESSMPRGVTLVTRIRCPADFTLYTDGRYVRQILSRLLDNAEQNTCRGEIKIECCLDKSLEHFDFTVSDTGQGSETAPGLDIPRALSEKLGGKLTVQSDGGGGSVFTLALPLDSHHRASA